MLQANTVCFVTHSINQGDRFKAIGSHVFTFGGLGLCEVVIWEG